MPKHDASHRHYLDHASTSPPGPQVVAEITEWLHGPVADPGRVHDDGRVAREGIERAREHVAELVGVAPRQVVFTSGGTEAINTAVQNATRARPGGVILCADVEHSSVTDASAATAPVEILPVDSHGRIEPDGLDSVLGRHGAETLALVHCQWANHEVGTIQPVAEILERCRAANVPVHVDACMAAGHLDLRSAVGITPDYLSISAHKFAGPPGTGALILRRGLHLEALLKGGQQERARRGGMENVPGILGFGAAAAWLTTEEGEHLVGQAATAHAHIAGIIDVALAVDGVYLVGSPTAQDRVPHLICIGIEGVEAEPILIGLDRAGISVHSGSACSSESLEPSPVLAAMGSDPNGSLRISVGWSTTEEDIRAFADIFPGVVADLRALRT